MAFLSMAFASVSVLYGVILILYLSTLRSEFSATMEDRSGAGRSCEERPRAPHLWMNDYVSAYPRRSIGHVIFPERILVDFEQH
jgi:hypothetical protein